MDLDWNTNPAASPLYAAVAVARGQQLIDPALQAALQPIVAALDEDLTHQGYSVEALIDQAVPLAVECPGATALAQATLGKVAGRAHTARAAPALVRTIIELRAAYDAVNPRAAEELPLRLDPLRGQWEARGPGLLAAVRRLTADDWLVPAASVALVQPVLGGGGMAYPRYNRVAFEAMLANPQARLPEVLRLGWLLAQLNFDLPKYTEPLGRERLAMVGRLALLPVVLAAAEEVELALADPEHLTLATALWLATPPQVGEVLAIWWRSYLASRPSWIAALRALHSLLAQP